MRQVLSRQLFWVQSTDLSSGKCHYYAAILVLDGRYCGAISTTVENDIADEQQRNN
jgi:hypothetical protein